MAKDDDRTTQYQEDSLTLAGTVMLGTGVMIGAGIFALKCWSCHHDFHRGLRGDLHPGRLCRCE
jgi:predicted transporter